ncbi:F-box protein at3g44326 [Phtheirospermum japonicum]|uniref:F-box protein at3g44326 n=1 Tax=Phtheirospermum japonicum TaxID=374723 RepID=A0A830D6A0_9LAMI|nr:F-box protein at3g44326 [Phtheirospermum japonicum]
MELDPNHMKSLSQDLILDIMSRLDGRTLAAIAATCIDHRDAAGDENLWQKLCHDTWPSTSKRKLPLEKTGGFKSLYADAFPLILQHEVKRAVRKTIASPTSFDTSLSSTNFISFIDIYYKELCIFSKVVDGIIEGIDLQRFLCYPFKLDVLGPKGASQDFQDFGGKDILTNLPSTTFLDYGDRRDISNKIVEDLRLSWILFDRRTGKAVNISSWRPRSIHKCNYSEEGYIICFGSVVTMDDGITTHISAEFALTAKCKLLIKQGCIRWTEITLAIKDIDGSHLNGERSVRVMKQALICTRSVNHYMVNSRYQQFCEQKTKLKLRNEQQESLANLFYATIAIAALLAIFYGCATLL